MEEANDATQKIRIEIPLRTLDPISQHHLAFLHGLDQQINLLEKMRGDLLHEVMHRAQRGAKAEAGEYNFRLADKLVPRRGLLRKFVITRNAPTNTP